MASDRLRRAALDGDQDALVELWRLNTRSPLPASSACCGPCDEHLSCRTTERTIDELALELGLHPERVRDQMKVRLQRDPGRRELRGALTVAMDLMAAPGISGSAAWRTVMGLVVPDPWGYSFDDSEPRRGMHEPCSPNHGLCWPWTERMVRCPDSVRVTSRQAAPSLLIATQHGAGGVRANVRIPGREHVKQAADGL